MPIGSYAAVPFLAQHLIREKPQRVLDLGAGSGGNGAIVRQWVDLGVQPWKTIVVGVEAWANYRNPLWDLYNVVVIETIEQFAHRQEQYDAILMTDVVEHFTLERGTELIQLYKHRVAPGGSFVISTPASFMEQGACYGNEFERHRSLWTEELLRQLGFKTSIVGQADWYCGEAIVAAWRPSFFDI